MHLTGLRTVALEFSKEVISRLDKEEQRAFLFFLRNISVGSLVAEDELGREEGISDVSRVISSLVEKGLLERKRHNYNLAPWIMEKMENVVKQTSMNMDLVEVGEALYTMIVGLLLIKPLTPTS